MGEGRRDAIAATGLGVALLRALRGRRLPDASTSATAASSSPPSTCSASRTRPATRSTSCSGSSGRSLLPFGSIAWRMSLFCAACGAARVRGALPAAAGAAPAATAVAALLAALLLAFAPSFWGEANVQRVYALNALFVVLAAWAAWRWHAASAPAPARARRLRVRARRDQSHLPRGLGAGARSLRAGGRAGAAAPPARDRWPRPRAALAGLLPYLYLPLRSRADPRLDWGDPETLDRFLDVVLRRDFWERAWIEGPAIC